VRFPKITINHAILVFGAEEKEDQIQFACYDPNDPSEPALLTFDRQEQRFSFPRNTYFKGGQVNVYQIYKSWNY
jgi:hypothetical protein